MHLRAALAVEIRVDRIDAGIAPEIPAAFRVVRVDGARFGLRIQHDDLVGIRHLVVAGAGIEAVADRLRRLQAAVEHHVHAAALAVAGFRDVGVARIVHAGVRALDEAALVEGDQLARQGGRRRLQVRVQVLQDVARLHEVAVVDEGRVRHGAGLVLSVVCDDGMARADRIDEADLRRRRARQLIEFSHLLHHRPRHGLVFRSAEQIYALAFQVGRVVDETGACKIVRRAQQFARHGRRHLCAARIHAGGQGIRQVGNVGKAARLARAEIRAAGDDAGAGHRGRVSDGKLRRHEAARGQAGHRGLAQVGLVGGQGGGILARGGLDGFGGRGGVRAVRRQDEQAGGQQGGG